MSSFDKDGDSQMQSSISSQPETDKPATPLHQQATFLSAADLSPPNSQGVPSLIPSTSANANGKRPLSTVETNGDIAPALRGGAAETSGKPSKVNTHGPSGYTWSKQEDEPGWAWKNKRAVDDANRALDSLVMKDRIIGNRYGDPFEMADRELAMLGSQQ